MTREQLEAEAIKLFPTYLTMCVWKKAQEEWKRKEWVKEQMLKEVKENKK